MSTTRKQEAALEKMKAGEGRNVEHVAMQDDETLAMLNGDDGSVAKRTRRR